MSLRPYIKRINDLVIAKDAPALTEMQCTVLEDIWSSWEKERPVNLIKEGNQAPQIITFEQLVVKRSPQGSPYHSRISVYDPEYYSRAVHYTWDADMNFSRLLAKAQYGDIPVPSPNTLIADKALQTFSYADMKDSNIAGLKDALDVYIRSMRGVMLGQEMDDILIERETLRTKPAFQTFFDHLAPGAWDIVAHANVSDISLIIKWLVAEGNLTVREARVQAAQAYPVLVPLFCGDTTEGFHYDRMKPVWEAIDKRTQMTEPLAHALGITTAVLRSLKKISYLPASVKNNDIIGRIPYLNDFDPSWHPKSAQDFQYFITACAWAEWMRNQSNVRFRSPQEILKEIRGEWKKWLHSGISANNINGVGDWIKEIQKNVIIPIIWREHIARKTADFQKSGNPLKYLFGIKTGKATPTLARLDETVRLRTSEFLNTIPVTTMIALSNAWHKDLEDYNLRRTALGVATHDQVTFWEPLSKPLQTPNGLWIRSLSTRDQLVAEGQALRHCVGGGTYAPLCYAGHDHIVSVSQDEAGNARLVTAQLRENGSIDSITGLKIVQCEGLSRRAPNREETEALNWYVQEIVSNPDLKPDWATIEAKRAVHRKNETKKTIEGHLGFEPTDPQASKDAYDLIRPYLPKRWSDRTYEETISKQGGSVVPLNYVKPI